MPKKTLILSKKSEAYPVFNRYLWTKIINNLEPVDAFILSRTSRRLLHLISQKCNRYWHYHFLNIESKLPTQYKHHRYPFKGECLTDEQKITLELPTSYNYYWNNNQNPSLPDYNEYYQLMGKELTEEQIIKIERTNKQTIPVANVDQITDITPCSYWSWHWSDIHYPIFHSAYDKLYKSKINYFDKYLYRDYRKNRAKYRRNGEAVINRRINKLKYAYEQYQEALKEKEKIEFYIEKYREDCPLKF